MIKIKACNHYKKWLQAYFFLQSIKIFKMTNLLSRYKKLIVDFCRHLKTKIL